MEIIDEVQKQKSQIQTDSYTMSLSELLNRWKDGDIFISPDYQRLFRWSIEQQTRFIESILLELPVPPIFLAQNEDSKFEVIDGLQRVSTLIKFFSPYLAGESAILGIDSSEDSDDTDRSSREWDLKLASKLEGATLLKSLNGYYSKTLPESLLISIKNYRIWFTFLKKESDRRSRYELFKRINTYGSPLSNQEIRNCTGRLLGQRFPTKLRELASSKKLSSAFGFSDEKNNNQYIEELLLRMLAFSFDKENAVHNITEFLDLFMEKASEGVKTIEDEDFSKIEILFVAIGNTFPNGDAFKFRKNGKPVGAFSTNIFDIVACGIFLNLLVDNIEELVQKIAPIFNEKEMASLTGAGSNTRKKMVGRIDFGKDWFSK